MNSLLNKSKKEQQEEEGPADEVPNFTGDFIALKFQKEGSWDAETASQFLEELKARREEFERQVFDTRYSERILREVHTHRRATKNAHKKSTFGGGSVLRGMDAFLIPQATKIIQMIQEEAPEPAIQAESEKFVRAYSPYEMPNPVVTAWNVNNQTWAVPLKMMTTWTLKQDDSKKEDTLEATNLDVEREDHAAEISEILGREVEVGHRVTTEETKLLQEGGFDLSRLNPGSTAFWSTPKPDDIARWDAISAKEYPRPDEKVIYLAPRYRSRASAKMTAYTWRNGVKHRFKIKLGEEVHPEIIVTRLRQYMGFHQDHMRHFPELKMYLGDKSYAQFERDIQVKYGTAQVRRHVLRRGVDEDTGEHWVVFRDVALEARPSTQIRVSPVDYGAYDGSKSRDVRSSALIYAFFAQGDHGTKNSREVLVEDGEGGYHVQHRFHDVGTSLGRAPILLRGPRDALNFPLSRNKPEEYDRNYIWQTKKGDVKFIWNDFWVHLRDHEEATFADFKWAARLIASLTLEEITEAVIWSGIPQDLVGAYVYHLANMRNRAGHAFGMQHGDESVPGRGPIQLDEPQAMTELVREDGYQVIKKGKIVGNYYQGSTILPLLQQNWFTLINGFLSGRSIGRDIGSQYVEASFMPLVRLDTHVGRTLWEREVPWTMTTFSVGIGLNATVARIVVPNPLYNGAEGRSRAYVVKDLLSFSVGVGFPAISSALARLGPELSISAELYRRRFEHIHYSETVAEGYKKPILVHKITNVGNIERLAVSSLTPGDVLREHKAVGAVAAGHAGFGLSMPYIGIASVGSSLSGEGGQTNWQTVSYTKDPVGALHLLIENDNERTLGAGTELLNLNASIVVNAASFALGHHRARINYDVWNIEIAPKSGYDLEHATDGINRTGPEADELVSVLKTLRKRPHLALPENEDLREFSPDLDVKLRFRAKANKKEARSNAQLLYLLNHDRKNDKTDFAIESEDYQYKFFTKSRSKRGYAGIEKTILDLRTPNSVIREGTSKRLMVEMDRNNPRSFVVWIDVFDYYRSLKRDRVLKLLDTLNVRYNNPDDDGNFFGVPPMATEEPYKRVYANARIYVNGDKLIQLVQNTDPKKLFEQLQSSTKKKINFKARRQIKSAMKDMKKAIERFSKLGENEKDKVAHKVQDRLAMAALKLVNHLYQSKKWGVEFLHQIMGLDGMMVVGEVYGIHDRSNMLQDPDWVSRLRFAGKSWGKITNVAPVSRFVRVDQPTPANEHAKLDIPLERFLGNIVTGYSGGWVGLGNR